MTAAQGMMGAISGVNPVAAGSWPPPHTNMSAGTCTHVFAGSALPT